MFYYLFMKSSLIKKFETNPKFLSVFLVGSFCYMLVHAFLNFGAPDLFNKIKVYFGYS